MFKCWGGCSRGCFGVGRKVSSHVYSSEENPEGEGPRAGRVWGVCSSGVFNTPTKKFCICWGLAVCGWRNYSLANCCSFCRSFKHFCVTMSCKCFLFRLGFCRSANHLTILLMQALFDLETTNQELKSDLRDLFINSAKYDDAFSSMGKLFEFLVTGRLWALNFTRSLDVQYCVPHMQRGGCF